ncbi:MAG TPA: hypothetical protein VMB22_07735 [Verrucomicrobiae bacterium]|nr:hypothetical protein [Verrucomicrobiae bacterium]
MKKNDIAIIGSVAIATATLTVAALLPGSLNAGNDNAPEKISQPKLVAHGVEFTLASVKGQTFKAGDEPAFNLKAVNTTGKDVDTTVEVTMTSMSPASAGSRMVSFPQTLWKQSCPVTLKPNETKVIALTTDTKLPAGTTINIRLQPVDPQVVGADEQANVRQPAMFSPSMIVAMSFSTIPPAQKISATAN